MTDTRTTPIAEAIASVSSDALVAFLQNQRWFAAKGSPVEDARLSSFVTTPWGDGMFALARATVVVGGVEHVYQLPLATRAPAPADLPPIALLSTSPFALYDAVRGRTRALGSPTDGPSIVRRQLWSRCRSAVDHALRCVSAINSCVSHVAPGLSRRTILATRTGWVGVESDR